MIDPRSIIDHSAILGSNVAVGPWSIIGPGVEIGDDCVIASHAVIKGPTRMGRNNRVFQFATIGEHAPGRRGAAEAETAYLEIGDGNLFREGVTVSRGAAREGSAAGGTVIGSSGLFMAYAHIGHDCHVGNHVVMANHAWCADGARIGDHAAAGHHAGVSERRRVGAHTHIEAMSLVRHDVPDYLAVAGNPATARGLNLDGLRQRGFAAPLIEQLGEAYRVVYERGLSISQACKALAELAAAVPEVAAFVACLSASLWGLVALPGGQAGAAER